MPVCVFYLILRGLDTVEDDTSIPIDVKQSLLRSFHDNLDQCGWNFTGNRPEEKDRELLVQFHNVIAEFGKLEPTYRAIIKEITHKMGTGMADFAGRAALGYGKVISVEEYDLYCWHVAGIVGEGLTHFFVKAGMGDTKLINQPLYRSMGLLLQKNNIIRDVREDFDDGRQFWPREIWSNHVDNFEDLFEPRNLKSALNCSSEMVLNAIGHSRDCLSYLAGLNEQSVFNFCAIPQTMALATLQLCFRNPAIFQHNVKLKKGVTLHLMIDSSRDIQSVAKIFSHYIRQIHQKNDREDPNYMSIKVACEEVCAFISRQ
jgi:farnesyl-diphosphate farnesyltransferase